MAEAQKLTWRTLFELLGSKSFLEIKALLLTVMPLMTIASLIASDSSSLTELSIWISGNAVVFGLLAAIVAILHKAIYGSNPTLVIPLFFVVLISAGLGFIKGLVITSWVRASDPSMMSEQEAIAAIIHNTILGVPSIMIASAVALALAELKQKQVYLAVAQNLRLLRGNSDRNQKKIDSIAMKLRELIDKLETATSDSVQSQVTAELRKIVETEVRPLARDLFKHREKDQKVVGTLAMSKLALSSRASAIGPALAMLFYLPHAIGWLGPADGLTFVVFSSIAIFLSIFFANQIFLRLGLRGPLCHIVSAAVLPTLVTTLILAMTTNQPFEDPLFFVWVPIWLFQVSFIVALMREIIHARAAAEISTLRISTEDQIRSFSKSRKTTREIAQQLHGSVQAKLLRLITISKGEEVLTNEEMVKPLQEILALLDQGEEAARDLKSEIVKLQQAWEGFIETDIQIDPLRELLPVGSLIEILQELILNSYRHGGAQKISISAAGDAIIAEDDGSYSASAKPGLGSLLFDSVCRDWNIQQTAAGGTRVELRLQQMLALDL